MTFVVVTSADLLRHGIEPSLLVPRSQSPPIRP